VPLVSPVYQQVVERVLTELAYALYSNTIKKPMDLERQDPLMPVTPPTSPVVAPNPRTGALRNFSLPRERCLDASPIVSARPLPIPPPYVATGINCTPQDKPRPLPVLPAKAHDPQRSLSDPQIIHEFVVKPLNIRKVSSVRSSLTLENAPKPEPSNTKSIEEARWGVKPLFDPLSFEFEFPDAADSQSTIIILPDVGSDDAQPFDAGSIIHLASGMMGTETPAETTNMIVEESYLETAGLKTPQHLIAPTIHIQAPTPTTPASSIAPGTNYDGKNITTPTVRLVGPYLEVPQKRSFSSLGRKWSGQPGFLSL
jgi:hypothetical protein